MAAKEKCKWINRNPEEENVYETSCGNNWQFTEDGIKENHCKYCPHCGREIEEIKDDQND